MTSRRVAGSYDVPALVAVELEMFYFAGVCSDQFVKALQWRSK